jgi:hypothetical protein
MKSPRELVANAKRVISQRHFAVADSPLELLMATGLIYAPPPPAIYYAFKR